MRKSVIKKIGSNYFQNPFCAERMKLIAEKIYNMRIVARWGKNTDEKEKKGKEKDKSIVKNWENG